jgi:hypothetical protein
MRRKVRLTSFGRFSLWASGVVMVCLGVYGVAHRFWGIDREVLRQLFAVHAPKNSSSFQIDTASIADSIAANVQRAQDIARKADSTRIADDASDTDTPDSLRGIIARMTAEQNALKKKLAELEKRTQAQGVTEKTTNKQSKTTRWSCRGKDFEHSFLNGVQQTSKATIVEVRFTKGLVTPKTYGQNQFLRYGKNKQLPIVSAYEVPDHPLANTDDIGKHVRIFRLEFPPLHSGVTSFDVIDINHNVNFYDIRTY